MNWEEELKCPGCNKVYVNPIFLPHCGHSLCEQCVKNGFEGEHELERVFCKYDSCRTFIVPFFVEQGGFQTNHALKALIEKRRKKGETMIVSDDGSDMAEITAFVPQRNHHSQKNCFEFTFDVAQNIQNAKYYEPFMDERNNVWRCVARGRGYHGNTHQGQITSSYGIGLVASWTGFKLVATKGQSAVGAVSGATFTVSRVKPYGSLENLQLQQNRYATTSNFYVGYELITNPIYTNDVAGATEKIRVIVSYSGENASTTAVAKEIANPDVGEAKVPDKDAASTLLLTDDEFSDCVLVSKTGTRFPCHKAMLAAKSKVLKITFTTSMKEKANNELTIEDAEDGGIEGIRNYIYTGALPKRSDDIGNILHLADKYELHGLVEHCERLLLTELSVENASATLAIAYRYNAKLLINATMEFMFEHNKEIAKTDGWKQLAADYPSLCYNVTKSFFKHA